MPVEYFQMSLVGRSPSSFITDIVVLAKLLLRKRKCRTHLSADSRLQPKDQ